MGFRVVDGGDEEIVHPLWIPSGAGVPPSTTVPGQS